MRYTKPTGHSEAIARLRKAEGWNDKRFAKPLVDGCDEPFIRTDGGPVTMGQMYGDGSAHDACQDCGMCKHCGDCACGPNVK